MTQKQLQRTQVAEDTLVLTGIDGAGLANVDAITLNTFVQGTGANNLVQLNSSAQLPAVDGSLLTNMSVAGLFTEDADSNIVGGTGAGANLTPTSSLNNFLAGVNAGANLTIDDSNIVIGNDALTTSQTSVSSNVAIGREAGRYAVVGTCVAVGYQAMLGVTGDSINSASTVAVGFQAGAFASGANNSLFIGTSAGSGSSTARITGDNNIFLGHITGALVESGSQNVGIGTEALKSVNLNRLTGDGNTAVGHNSIKAIQTTANSNTALGSLTGANISTGAGNVMLGYAAGPTANQSNKLYIDNVETDTPLIFGDFSTNTIVINGTLTVTGGVDALASATTVIDVSSAIAPVSGQVLTATNGTAATWETPTGNNLNVIINGNFDIWQRGTSQTTSDYDSDDRWKNTNIGSTKVSSQQPFTLGQTDVPNNPKYYARTVVTSVVGATNYVVKAQKIEDVSTFSGETVTVSFWAKADANKNISAEFTQNFGTGGSPSAQVTGIGSATFALTTSWAKHTTIITLPSVVGATLGTSENDNLQFIYWLDAGSSFDSRTISLGQQSGTFDIAQVQIEKGSIATDFERRTVGQELTLCQRYYTTEYIDIYQGSITNGAGDDRHTQSLQTPMRAAGDVDTSSIATGGAVTLTSATVGGNNNSVVTFFVTLTATANQIMTGVFSVDAEL